MKVSENLKINQLRKIAGDLGLSAGGSKKELVKRINGAKPTQDSKPEDHFRTEIARVADILVDYPAAISVGLRKVDGRHAYQFIDQTPGAQEAREKIIEILGDLWQSGAYNYEQLARALRVKVIDIQGVLDVEFSHKNNL